jgi:hypothetical protein
MADECVVLFLVLELALALGADEDFEELAWYGHMNS